MSCDAREYENVTPERFATLKEKAAANGLMFSGTWGTIESHGCKFAWNYSGLNKRLVIQCTHVPWIYGCEHVNQKLDELMKE